MPIHLMVEANWTPGGSPGSEPQQLDLAQLRDAVKTGDYTVPAEAVATAVLRWHRGFRTGAIPHEVAHAGTGLVPR